jgi:hypothetical protein
MRYTLSLLLLLSQLFSIDLKTNLENNNILNYQKEEGTTDYNRLRLTLDISSKEWEDINSKIIIDNENTYNFKKSNNQNRSRFYRAYIQYSGDIHSLTIGLQRVPFGVGRIWNPIDLFNPINITAIETDERKGTESIRYEYAINSLSNLDMTLSNNKQAVRVKGYLDIADVAFVVEKDQQNSEKIIGYEIEGELPKTDITLRSEGGYFTDTDSYRYIIGAEYAFENSLTILSEFYHDMHLKNRQLALNLSYQFSALLYLNFLAIGDFDNDTLLISPSFTYSLSDESTISTGVFLEDKDNQNRYYMHYFINF